MTDLTLKCNCGKVQGVAKEVSPEAGNHVVCYCDDCQAFIRHLGQEETVLDPYGGTEIFQLPPSQVRLTQGADKVRCLRLTPRGTFRWYTDCCNTPIGNTLTPAIPFIGMIHSFIDDADSDQKLGPVCAYAYTKFAKATLPAGRKQSNLPLPILIRTLYKLLCWKLTGKGRPSPFFDDKSKPVAEPYIVNPTPKT